MTVRERTDRVSPLEKFTLLASEVDAIRDRLAMMTREQSVDQLLELVEVETFARDFDVFSRDDEKRLVRARGKVFKLGKKQIIRKVNLLEVMESLERDESLVA